MTLSLSERLKPWSYGGQVCGLEWSPDDRELASGGNDNQLLVWGSHGSQPQLRFAEHSAAVKAISWSPHQHGLLASGGGTADRCIRFWNTVTGSAINHVDTGMLLVSCWTIQPAALLGEGSGTWMPDAGSHQSAAFALHLGMQQSPS